MFKVLNKKHQNDVSDVFLGFLLLVLNIITPASSVSIVEFEQVNITWKIDFDVGISILGTSILLPQSRKKSQSANIGHSQTWFKFYLFDSFLMEDPLQRKSIDWFLYNRDLHRESVKPILS